MGSAPSLSPPPLPLVNGAEPDIMVYLGHQLALSTSCFFVKVTVSALQAIARKDL